MENQKELKAKLALQIKATGESLAYARKLKTITNKFCKIAILLLILASPVLLLLSPVILILGTLLYIWRPGLFTGSVKSEFKTKIAYIETIVENSGSATQKLIDSADASAQSAGYMVRCLQAKSDKDWLENFSKWAEYRQVSEVSLNAGAEDRFFRIRTKASESKTDGPLISIIMPAYMAEESLASSVESVLSQSWTNWELIIVDDHSSDQTLTLARQFARVDPRIKVIQTPSNSGPYVAKNIALDVAKGAYVTGHDADDIATANRLEQQIAPLLSNPQIFATMASGIRLSADGMLAAPYRVNADTVDGTTKSADISLMIHRETMINRFGYWDEVRYGADSELIARIRNAAPGGIEMLTIPVFFCLQSDTSLTGNAATGITSFGGLSPTRKAYREAWVGWHKTLNGEDCRLSFPQESRKFYAPPEMLNDY